MLGGYLHALLSYPERIYKGVEVFHPHTKELVACGPPLQGVMPKELELIAIIKGELEQRRKVMVYFQNSLSTDISPRIVSMLERRKHPRESAEIPETQKIGPKSSITGSRKGWTFLMTNPKKVEVGMDLLDFPSIIFYQIPMSTYTLRQASRRSWRIPQTKPVKVYFFDLQRHPGRHVKCSSWPTKLISSLALEGELSDKGLAALSDTSDSMAKGISKDAFRKSGIRR